MPQPTRIGIAVDQMLPVPICFQGLENIKPDRLSEQVLFILDAFPQGSLGRASASTSDMSHL